MHDTRCLGLVHWDDPEGWYGEGGGMRVRMGNTCIPVADSCGCMAKPIQYCKVIYLQLNKFILKKKIKIMASSLITSAQIDAGKVETVTDFIFLVMLLLGSHFLYWAFS